MKNKVPRLRFSKFKDEWEKNKVINIAPLQRGFDLVKKNIIQGEYPVGYSNGILAYHNEFKVEGPGVFTGRSGTIGNVHYTEENYWPHNTSLWVTDFKGNSEKFIYYFYKNLNPKRYDAGSGVPTLNRNDIHSLTKFVPCYEEQQKIADFFTLLDRRIEQQQEKVEAWRAYKKGMMQKLFSRELRYKDEDGGEFPEWKVVSLDSVSNINPKTEPLDNTFQYIDLESVMGGQLKGTTFINKQNAPSRAQRVIRKGDILYQTVSHY